MMEIVVSNITIEEEMNRLSPIISENKLTKKGLDNTHLTTLTDTLIIDNLVDNLSADFTSEVISKGIDIFSLILIDYYSQFTNNGKVETLLGKSIEEKIDILAEELKEKEIVYYTKNPVKKNNNFLLGDIETKMAIKSYLGFISNPEIKNLISRTINKNDLKAILMIDKLFPLLKYNRLEEILESDLNPEQIFITLAKIRYREKPLKDLDKYISELESFSENIKAIVTENFSENNTRRLYEIMVESKTIDSKFDYFRDNEYYQKLVANLFEIINEIYMSINNYVERNTIGILATINPKFPLTGSIEDDLRRNKMNSEQFANAEFIFNLFKKELLNLEDIVSKINLEEIKSKINSRHNYLIQVEEVKPKLEIRLNELNKYSNEIEELSSEALDQNLVEKLLKIKRNIKEHLQDFNKWGSDYYLAESAKQLTTASNSCLGKIGNIKNQIFGQIKHTLLELDPNFESTHQLGEDKEINSAQLEELYRISRIYELFGIKDKILYDKLKAVQDRQTVITNLCEICKDIYTYEERIANNRQRINQLFLKEINNKNSVEMLIIQKSLLDMFNYCESILEAGLFSDYDKVKVNIMRNSNFANQILENIKTKFQENLTLVGDSVTSLEQDVNNLSPYNAFTRLKLPNLKRNLKLLTFKKHVGRITNKNNLLINTYNRIGQHEKEIYSLYEENSSRITEISQNIEELIRPSQVLLRKLKKGSTFVTLTSLILFATYTGKERYASLMEQVKNKYNLKYNLAKDAYETGDFNHAYNLSNEIMKDINSSLLFKDDGIYRKVATIKQNSKAQIDAIMNQRMEEYKQEILKIISAGDKEQYFTVLRRSNELKNEMQKTY